MECSQCGHYVEFKDNFCARCGVRLIYGGATDNYGRPLPPREHGSKEENGSSRKKSSRHSDDDDSSETGRRKDDTWAWNHGLGG